LADYKIEIRVNELLCEYAMKKGLLLPDSLIILMQYLPTWLIERRGNGRIGVLSFSFLIGYALCVGALPQLITRLANAFQFCAGEQC
jgi:hypothetical protein